MSVTPKLYAARQHISRKAKLFRLDPTNETRLSTTLARYADIIGSDVSLSVLIPRALVALNDELNRAAECQRNVEPTAGEMAMPSLKDRERLILRTLSPS